MRIKGEWRWPQGITVRKRSAFRLDASLPACLHFPGTLESSNPRILVGLPTLNISVSLTNQMNGRNELKWGRAKLTCQKCSE